MDELDFWRLNEELTILEAACLVAGVDPAGNAGSYCEGWEMHLRPPGYEAAKTAISRALLRGTIKGTHIPIYETDNYGTPCGEVENSTNMAASLVEVESLRAWLAGKGFRSGFFFPIAPEAADYLNPSHPRYAIKLAALVRAWQAVTDPGNRTPKQAIQKWLKEHAAEFGLTDENGDPRTAMIEDLSAVANWRPEGGAPKTPGQ